MKLEFHPEAELELIDAAEHYELQVPALGERFQIEFRRTRDMLLGTLISAFPSIRRFARSLLISSLSRFTTV